MRKHAWIFAAALMSAGLPSAVMAAAENLAVETAWISEYHEDVEGELITVRYDSVMLADAMSTVPAPIQEVFDQMDRTQIDEAVEYRNWYEYLLTTYQQDNGSLKGFVPCSYYASANMKRFDDRYTSVLYKVDAYAGGAHPNCWYRGYNFHTATGEAIALTDVVTDTDKLTEVLRDLLAVCYPELDASALSEYPPAELVWTLEEDGITIYIGEYMLGSLYDGAQTIHIAYKDHADLFREGFVDQTVFETKALGNYEPVWLDADEDGVPEGLSVGMNTGEGRYADQNRYLNLSYHGRELQVHLPECNALYRTLLTSEGTTYLYLQADMDMDIAWAGVYELNGDEAVYQGDDLPPGSDPRVSHMVIQYPVNAADYVHAQNLVMDHPEPEDYREYSAPFYGVWISASKDLDASWALADLIRYDGISGSVYISSDWANLNPETWYLVSAGIYDTYEEALTGLDSMHAAGYTDAYIKWSGEYLAR